MNLLFSRVRLCDPMDCSMPGFPVLSHLLEFAQIHVNWCCYLPISSSAAHFSCCLQSFPASGSFPISQLFISGGPSTGASASALLHCKRWFCCFKLFFVVLLMIVNSHREFLINLGWCRQVCLSITRCPVLWVLGKGCWIWESGLTLGSFTCDSTCLSIWEKLPVVPTLFGINMFQ